MEQSALGMTRGQSVAGCLVLLTAVLCGAASAPWAEQRFSRLPVTAEAAHTRICVTISGKRFEWNFPNPPFGTLSCSQ